MTVQNAPATDEYTAYEYATVRVPHTFEPLFRDTYPGFGWTVENPRATTSVASVPLGRTQRSETVTLQLKRDRNLKNRDMVRAAGGGRHGPHDDHLAREVQDLTSDGRGRHHRHRGIGIPGWFGLRDECRTGRAVRRARGTGPVRLGRRGHLVPPGEAPPGTPRGPAHRERAGHPA